MILRIICVAFIIFNFIDSNAQNADSVYKRSWYVYGGIGWGGQKYASSFGFVAQVGKKSTIALAAQWTRKTSTEDVLYFYLMSPVPQKVGGNISLLYGQIFKYNWGHFILMAGPAYAGVTNYDHPDSLFPDNYAGTDEEGIGLSVQGMLMPSVKFAGFGVNLFLNVNSVYTHGGITFNLALGRINYTRAD
jgi:hypothetical protein